MLKCSERKGAMQTIKNVFLIIMLVTSVLSAQEKEEKTEQTNIEDAKNDGTEETGASKTVKNNGVEKTLNGETQEKKSEESKEVSGEGTKEESVQDDSAKITKEQETEKEAIANKEKKEEDREEVEKKGEEIEKADEEKKKEEVVKEEAEKEPSEEKEDAEEEGEEEGGVVVQEAPTIEIEKEELPVEVKQAEPAEQIVQEIEEVGIDTINIDEPQGNWLFKRMWWEHAEDRYEKIRALVQKIWESRMGFFVKRNELDKMILDPFYISIGLGQGELQEILAELVGRIEKERQEEGMLSQKERALLDQLQAEKQTLEQTKLDVESISQLDKEIDQALNRLMEQINRVRAYEQESWEYFKDIARILNDKKARELFFKIDTALRNVKSIDDYLQQDFTQHFNQLLQRVNEQVNKVVNAIQRLKEKGVDFKKQLDVLEEQSVAQEEREEEEEEATTSWRSRLWNKIVAIVRWPYDKLVGKQEGEPSE